MQLTHQFWSGGRRGARLAIADRGPALPTAMRDTLLDLLGSQREKGRDDVHLGFGHYVMKLVAELHSARVKAHDLSTGDGVELTLHLRRVSDRLASVPHRP